VGCRHDDDCDDGETCVEDRVDEGTCKSGCPVYDPALGCDDADGWFWWFDGESCHRMEGCVCGGCPGTFGDDQAACRACEPAP